VGDSLGPALIGLGGTGLGAVLGYVGAALSARRETDRVREARQAAEARSDFEWHRDRKIEALASALDLFADVPYDSEGTDWPQRAQLIAVQVELHCDPSTAAVLLPVVKAASIGLTMSDNFAPSPSECSPTSCAARR